MEEITHMERDLQEQSARLNSRADYVAWEERCNECLESLEEQSRTKRLRLSIGVRQSLVGRIVRLESLKNSLRGRFIQMGAGSNARENGLIWREIDTAFESRVLTGAIINYNHIEPRQFLEDASDIVYKHVLKIMKKYDNVKVNTVFNGEFVVGNKRANKSVNTENYELCLASDLHEWYERHVVEPTLSSLEEFQERDSGWALSRILNLTININKYNPMRAGCHISLPREIMTKRAVVEVRSTDNACFAWAVVAALYPAERHVERESSYPHYTQVLNFQDIEFPMTIKQITTFEHLNDISVNVYTFEKREKTGLTVIPILLTRRKMDKHVNLLYMQDSQDYNVEHFAWIKNLSRLVSSQISKKEHKKYICDRCLHYFASNDKLQSHAVDCQKMNDCAIMLPSEDDKWLNFNNYSRKEQVPFVVYADLECILEKIRNDGQENMYQHHKVYSIGYYVHCSYGNSLSVYHSHRGGDCVSWFAQELCELAHRVKIILSNNVPMVLTDEQYESYGSATHCQICEKPFAQDDTRVRDHCRLTGRYRGAAHSKCNLNYKNSYNIPIIFHNLSGYDAHFIIKEIATVFDGKVDVLPITKEKYISFIKTVTDTEDKFRECMKLRFIDSYKFLNTSLEKLASFLSKDKLKILKSIFHYESEENFDLLTRKGVFPYEYIDCVDRLQDACLPPRELFYSSLTGGTISESDYAHAANVWKRFSIRVNIGEYR